MPKEIRLKDVKIVLRGQHIRFETDEKLLAKYLNGKTFQITQLRTMLTQHAGAYWFTPQTEIELELTRLCSDSLTTRRKLAFKRLGPGETIHRATIRKANEMAKKRKRGKK